MMKTTKKFKKINTELDLNSTYDPDKAFEILKNYSSKKFDESVDIAINLGIDPKKSIILDTNKIFGNSKKFQFYWYTAKSLKPNLSAYAFHVNKISGNSSGEHNF